MRVLITGITGMVGSHLAEYLLLNYPDVEVFGIKRWRSPLSNLENVVGKATLLNADLLDSTGLRNAIHEVRPEVVFHLAAQSDVQTSFLNPSITLQTNILGTFNLLESIRFEGLDPIIHVCSSSEVYGDIRKEDAPVLETYRLQPASPYAVSKAGEDLIGHQFFLSYGLRVIRTRMFTHTGPRRGDVFAESAFAKQIARIEKGLQEPVILVGNLNSVRTYADVRDAVRAYWLLVKKCIPGETYNIGGTRTMTVGKMLDFLMEQSTVKNIAVRIKPELLRPSDVSWQIPNIEKFQKQTGWKPEIPFEQTMCDLLDYWRARV